MFLIHVNYTKPLTEVDKHLLNHRSYLDKHYRAGNLLISGRRNPTNGGLILTNFAKRVEVDNFIKGDPFFTNEVAKYEVIEFQPTRCDSRLLPLLHGDDNSGVTPIEAQA